MLKNWLPFPSKGEMANHIRQIDCLLGVYSLLNHGYSLGPLRGWAISPDALSEVLRVISTFDRPTVVEFGSGQSTIAISKLLTSKTGRLISVEHDAKYSFRFQDLLQAYNLEKPVTTIIAPLALNSVGDTTYSMELLPEVSPDVVLVDGPPGKGRSRLTPLLWAYSALKPRGVILLDDYNREDEKECVRCLLRDHPDALVEEYRVEKGLVAIKKPSE
jgi:predicted O-methyltransferase YrrM